MDDDPLQLLTQHKDRARAQSFGAEAERYERTRPTYPAALVDDLISELPSAVLDVGCGTGKAGRLFADRGCAVTGVEPDARMAEVARRFGIDVEVSTFEEWDPRGRRFDLVTAGQSWHWVDPSVGPPKARSVLRDGGRLAAFANVGHHEPEMEAALDVIYARYMPDQGDNLALGRIRDETRRGFMAAMAATPGLDQPEHRTYEWDRDYTTAEWVDHLPSHSNHAALAPEALEALLADVGNAIDERGGVMHMHFVTTMVTARAV